MRPNLDEYYMTILPALASRATCVRRATSAILVDKDGRLLASGYNGPPRGLTHCTDNPCEGANDPSGDTTRCLALHAEVNACVAAGDRLVTAHTIYTLTSPCLSCSLVIANSPIKRVVYRDPYPDDRCVELFKRCSISLKQFPINPRPKIICLCGSTRFVETWVNEYQRLSDEGNIVLTVARMPPRPNLQHDEPELKIRLDNLHLRKIDLADEIFVLDVDGYIGESTKREIEYATKKGKTVRYLSGKSS